MYSQTNHFIFVHLYDYLLKESLGAVVKLLHCDHEVRGSSSGNSFLQKCRERLRTIDPKWSDPSPELHASVVPNFYTFFLNSKTYPVLALLQNGEFAYQYRPNTETHISIGAS